MSRNNCLEATTKPFLKWAGSKKWLISSINKFLPTYFNKYYEPFLGSGAVFFALKPEKAQLSDLNKNLIDTYITLTKYPYNIIKELKAMSYDKEFYYQTRDNFQSKNKVKQAARLIYLNRTCWNGLYRENKDGKFNVPFGKYENPTICDEDKLKAAGRALKNTSFRICDFEEAVSDAKEGDFIFFDPPYITGHQNNGFHFYNANPFSWEDQKRLARVAKNLDRKGCFVLITNANNRSIRKLYSDFIISKKSRKSVIAADIKNRKKVDELIITNYGLGNKITRG
jgi:DNA adenine methylase